VEKIKVFASLFQKAVVSKGKAFGRAPQSSKHFYRSSAKSRLQLAGEMGYALRDPGLERTGKSLFPRKKKSMSKQEQNFLLSKQQGLTQSVSPCCFAIQRRD